MYNNYRLHPNVEKDEKLDIGLYPIFIEKNTINIQSYRGRIKDLRLDEYLHLEDIGSAFKDNKGSCVKGSDRKTIEKAKKKIYIEDRVKIIKKRVFQFVKILDIQHYSYKVTGYPESVRITLKKNYIRIELNNVLQRRLFTTAYTLSRRVLEYIIRKRIFRFNPREFNDLTVRRKAYALLRQNKVSKIEIAIDITYSHGIVFLESLRSAATNNSKLRIEENTIYYNSNKRRWVWKYYNKSLKDRIDQEIEPYYPMEGDVYRFEITLCRDLFYFLDLKEINKIINSLNIEVSNKSRKKDIQTLIDLRDIVNIDSLIKSSKLKRMEKEKEDNFIDRVLKYLGIKKRLDIKYLKKSQHKLLCFLSQNCIKPFKTFFDFMGELNTVQFLKDLIRTTTLSYTPDNITKKKYLKLLRDVLFKTRPVDLLLKSKSEVK